MMGHYIPSTPSSSPNFIVLVLPYLFFDQVLIAQSGKENELMGSKKPSAQ